MNHEPRNFDLSADLIVISGNSRSIRPEVTIQPALNSMMASAQATLTSDVQRALQHAVIEVNNTFLLPEISKANKKKRATDDVQSSPGETRRKKKKRSMGVLTGEITSSKKGKRKRDKGIAPDSMVDSPPNGASPIDPKLSSLDVNSQPSATAFLSAIVAAASATSDTDSPAQAPISSHSHGISQPTHGLPEPHLQYPYHDRQFGHPHPALPLSELPIGSNDDILRAVHDLDISKIATVLKTLTDAAAAANISLPQPTFIAPAPSSQQTQGPTALGQIPVASDTLLAHQGSQLNNQPYLDLSRAAPVVNYNHAQLLSSKWLNANKLAELVRTEGLVYKKGKFSAIEESQLKDAIENYRVVKQLTPDQLNDVIFASGEKSKESTFWSEITGAVPQRPIIAIYHHVRRSYHPDGKKGKWTPCQDESLKQAVADLGQQWEKVSLRVCRMASDCRDRYRNHIANREYRVSGQWTKDEEDELTRIVTEMTVKQGKDIDDDVFWGRVSERMANRRGRQQCRIKWTDSLSKVVKNEGQKPRWSQQDAYILVHKIASLSVRDDTEIDWKTFSDSRWKLWSAHSLQRRWLSLKRSVKGYENMSHQEIMDILRVKKAHVPAPSPASRKRKVSSTEIITEDTEVQPEAGPSFGPAMLPQGQLNLAV